MKTIIIVDDEEDGRKLIRQYLSAYPEFQLIGEAEDGLSAVELINTLQPDVVFLDIQMPGLTGFEVLTKLDRLPQIIFSTAYDQYAIKAFEVHALDYLLKPYGKQRFSNAITRIESNSKKLEPLAEQLLQENRVYPEKVIVHKGIRKLLIDVSRIVYMEAFGDYTKIFTKQQELLSTSGISNIQKKLNPKQFQRIHRSYLVNLNQVKELKKIDRYHYLILDQLEPIRISDKYLPFVKSRII